MEQIEHLKKAKVNLYISYFYLSGYIQAGNKSDNEILVSHVESQKRLIERLEGDMNVIVDQHKHFLNQVKLKQVIIFDFHIYHLSLFYNIIILTSRIQFSIYRTTG